MPEQETSALRICSLRAGYGNRDVLSDLGISVQSGEFLGLVGHNGAGKSTFLKAVAGILPIREGDILLDGHSIVKHSIHDRIGLGITYLPQGSPVFSRLTVRENLLLRVPSGYSRHEAYAAIRDALSSFPPLRDREDQRSGSLSGGEKQMLALAGALLVKPRFLLLDEPSLGLSPALVSATLDRLRELAHGAGVGILMVEQKIREALRVCDRLVVMRQGRLVFDSPSSDVAAEGSQLRELCL